YVRTYIKSHYARHTVTYFLQVISTSAARLPSFQPSQNRRRHKSLRISVRDQPRVQQLRQVQQQSTHNRCNLSDERSSRSKRDSCNSEDGITAATRTASVAPSRALNHCAPHCVPACFDRLD